MSITVLAGNRTIPPNREITITQPLTKPSIALYIKLRKKNKICATRQIMHGTRDSNANGKWNKLMYLRRYLCIFEVTALVENIEQSKK